MATGDTCQTAETPGSVLHNRIQEKKRLGKTGEQRLEHTYKHNEFGKLSYQHCSREANKIADSLAKFGTSREVHRFWEDDRPDFISSMIVNEMAIIR